MISLPELLEDKKYREFFLKVPKTVKPAEGQLPWRVYIQREPGGSWAKKEHASYVDAFKTIRLYLKRNRLHDGAIQSRGIAYGPPERIVKITKGGRPLYHERNGKRVLGTDGKPIQVTETRLWRPRIEASEESHTWCSYCRRPTVFRWFLNHHALKASGLQDIIDKSDRRCSICGVREEFNRTISKTSRPPGFDPLAHVNVKRSRTRR